MQIERRGPRGFGLGCGDLAVFEHGVDDDVAPAKGPFRAEDRRKLRWAFRKSSQQRGFRKRELTGMLREVILSPGLETVDAAAQVNLIAVEGEDLLLGEGVLDLERKKDFLQLAGGGAFVGEEEIARELHGERGSALRTALGENVVPGGAGNAEQVDAPMALEVAVFSGNDSLAQDRGKIVVVHDDTALQGEGAKDAAMSIVELGGGAGAIMFQLIDLRKVDRVDQGQSCEAAS